MCAPVATASRPTISEVSFGPARELVARGVADRHPTRGHAAHRRAQEEGHENRRQGEHRPEAALLVDAGRLAAQREGSTAKDDSDRGREEGNRERRGDRPEGLGKARPHHHEDEDQPDVVGLPDRCHGVLDACPQSLVAGGEVPDAGAEVRSSQHRVSRDAQGDQKSHEVGQHRVTPPSACAPGAAASLPQSRRGRCRRPRASRSPQVSRPPR